MRILIILALAIALIAVPVLGNQLQEGKTEEYLGLGLGFHFPRPTVNA